MHVDIFHFSPVDLAAQDGAALVGGAPGDGPGPGQFFIDAFSGRPAGQNPDSVGLPLVTKIPGLFGDGPGHGLGRPGAAEPAEATVAPEGIFEAASSAVIEAN